ncbi:hypothetical protein [Streptomyces sp. NPDC054961]
MTDSSTPTPKNWRTPVVLLCVTALLLLPPVLFWYHSAQNALANKSGSDWRGNHRTKQGLEHAALLIGGVPSLGALIGWACGSAKGRPGTWTAGGALLGTLALWIVIFVAVCVSLSNTKFSV